MLCDRHCGYHFTWINPSDYHTHINLWSRKMYFTKFVKENQSFIGLSNLTSIKKLNKLQCKNSKLFFLNLVTYCLTTKLQYFHISSLSPSSPPSLLFFSLSLNLSFFVSHSWLALKVSELNCLSVYLKSKTFPLRICKTLKQRTLHTFNNSPLGTREIWKHQLWFQSRVDKSNVQYLSEV